MYFSISNNSPRSSFYKLASLLVLLTTGILSGCTDSSTPPPAPSNALSNNANLTSISLSTSTLSPSFSSSVTSYTVAVANDTTSITVSANAEDSAATAVVNSSGSNSDAITLAVGDNAIGIEVTAEDGTTVKSYNLVVTRAVAPLSNNADLSALSLSGIVLDQTFQASQLSYTASVAFTIISTTITASVDDSNASLLIDGGSVTALTLAEGANTINVVVTAEDSTTSKTYSIEVTRQAAGVFAQQAFLKASNADGGASGGDVFGFAVAMSPDRLVVGARGEDSGSLTNQSDESKPQAGAVYVFVNNSGTWVQEAYLKASRLLDTANFGISVDISGDYIAVGASAESTTALGNFDLNFANTGAVYIFKRTGSVWAQHAYIKAPNAEQNDYFGGKVSIDGTTLAVSATWESSGSAANQNDNSVNRAGAVYVYGRSADTWAFEDYLKAANPTADDYFGTGLSLDNDTLAIGALHEDGSLTGNGSDDGLLSSGAVYVYTRNPGGWAQQAYLKASNGGISGKFGESVSLSGDTLAVKGKSSSNDAYAYVYVRSTGTWSEQAALFIHSFAGLEYGSGIALENDTLLVGRANADDGGEATLFTRTGTTWTQELVFQGSNTESDDTFGASMAISDSTIAVGAYREDSNVADGEADNSKENAGAVYLFE